MGKTESAPGESSRAPFANATIRQTERRDAAYRAAWEEIDGLEPGEMIQYHEGNLGADVAHDPEIAGRAAAYRHAATDLAKGTLAQRRVRFEWYQYIFRRSGS
ncbi:MAG: hypothetical protein ACREJ0_07940 [Geminicoccaceae bacterium]